jgi:methionine synthase / methylenetetrahydrofolate reductase(NADPH)
MDFRSPQAPLGVCSTIQSRLSSSQPTVFELEDTPTQRRERFLQRLLQGQSFLFDGAVATLLYERGVFINRSFDEVNLAQPDLVLEAHREYLSAGAEIITTNTWGANTFKLKSYGLEEKYHEINTSGAKLARQVAGNHAWVAGSVGPLGVRIEPWGPTSFEEAKLCFQSQVKALMEGGVDLFVLESFADLNEIRQAILAIREICDFPIVAQMTTNEEGQSLFGTEPEWFAQKLGEWGADVVGVNGGNGPSPALEILKRLKSATPKPIVLQPNAGLPRQVDGRLIYMASPEYMGEFARQALLQGARMLGGCSGTTPAHTRAMAGAFRQGKAFSHRHSPAIEVRDAKPQISPVPMEEKSLWSGKIARKEFAVCMELLPPKGLDTEKLIERSMACKNAGVDAINIPDGPRASARMSALAAACLIERDAGIETILHYACRDRNLLGIQSDLIGAAGLGLRNILAITGDPPKMGPYPNCTAVFDIDAIGLVNMISRLNQGLDLGGSSIGRPTRFGVGVGANPVSPDLEKERSRFAWKVQAGAEWAITQPVFEAESLLRFLDFSSQFSVPIIAGIWPLTSLRNAEFMANEVPGVYVPASILERMRNAGGAESQRAEGLLIAKELIEKIRPMVQGLQISAPLGNVDFALELLR